MLSQVDSMTPQPAKTSRSRFYFLGLLILSLLYAGPGIRAQQEQPAKANPPTPPQEPRPAQPQQPEAPGVLHLMVGRSLVLTSPVRIKRVSIADPNIADAIIVSPNQILINGKAPGGVTLVLWDENDQNQPFDVFVDLDILGISQKIREVFPQESVRVEASKDAVMLSGRASSKEIADKIFQVVSATTPKVISLIEVPAPPPPREVQLAVKFAEVNRAALEQLGVNLFSTNPKMVGSTSTQQFAPPQLQSLQQTTAATSGGTTQSLNTNFTFSDLLNVFLFRPDINVGTTINALQQRNLLQILAEPNLLTETGKEASFLAGGEFPFPVVQGGAAGSVPTVTVQFKEFGVRLSFTPTLTTEGKIHLKVRPEVSALDFSNALRISGFLIPALSTRRVEAEMELEDGQSFAIAGLVDDRLTQVASKIPGLGDIPILGYLFRSRSRNKTKTELLVVVTPRVVKPLLPGQVPAGPQFPVPFLPPAAPEKAKPGQK